MSRRPDGLLNHNVLDADKVRKMHVEYLEYGHLAKKLPS
jgi:hypothetical protein